jgi:hypothetical protein
LWTVMNIKVINWKSGTSKQRTLWNGSKHNMVVSNHVNSDHVPSFSCLDVWNVRQTTSGVYAITVTTSTYHSRRCGRL